MTVLRADGTECNARELGRITVRLPLPPGTMCTLYKAPERFVQTYFTRFKVSTDLLSDKSNTNEVTEGLEMQVLASQRQFNSISSTRTNVEGLYLHCKK